MSLSLFILIASNLLPFFIIFAFASASNSCQTKCGRIEIPFPFGIGKDCYLNKWYKIKCVNNTAFLSAFGKEVAFIGLPVDDDSLPFPRLFGLMRIKNPITSKGCSKHKEEGDSSGSLLNLNGSPFFVSKSNTLVVIGCDFTASFTNLEPNVVGCTSTCASTNSLPTSEVREICNGTGCCQTHLPDDRFEQTVGVRIKDNTPTTTTTTTPEGRECKVAFLVSQPPYILGSILEQIHTEGYSWVEISWFIPTTNDSFIRSLGCQNGAADIHTSYSKSKASCVYENYDVFEFGSCKCSSGFIGNPFILGGCKDINECLDKTSCSASTTCVNLPGYYKCEHKKTLPIVKILCSGFGVLILIGGIYWLFKFIKRRRKIIRKRKFFKRNGGLLLQQQLISTENNVDKTRIFSSKELEKATENFSMNRMLGQGGQGTVFKGMLTHGGIVAVKKSIAIDEDKLEEFINEVVILSQINHRNIVKLLGCCLETEVPILIYEFIPNGNLFEHLHDDLEDSTITTWKVRLRIAVDIAGALSYLHSAASFPIYHRDIKSTNIMLDAKYRAKVSDFGTSRSVTVDHTHLTTVVSGTVGYVDPEYFQSSQFTDKSDVYSFGVVLVELITGAKPFSFLRSQENRALATYFIVAMKQNRLDEIVDARIKDCKMEQVIAAAKLAKKCLNMKGKKRPSMRQVSMELERIHSSEADLEAQVYVVESDEEEQVHVEVEPWNDVVVAAASMSSFEAGPALKMLGSEAKSEVVTGFSYKEIYNKFLFT